MYGEMGRDPEWTLGGHHKMKKVHWGGQENSCLPNMDFNKHQYTSYKPDSSEEMVLNSYFKKEAFTKKKDWKHFILRYLSLSLQPLQGKVSQTANALLSLSFLMLQRKRF